MKNSIKLILIVILAATLQLNASSPYKPIPVYYNGAMTPYDFSLEDPNVAWTDSLKPVYVCYISRHGTRYLTGPGKFKDVAVALKEAEKEGMLTEQGKKFLGLVRVAEKDNAGRWGLLSEVGIAEASRLGSNMTKLMPGLFKNGKSESRATYVPRAIMTMYQFLHSLEIPNKKLEVYTSAGRQNDSLLRFFTEDKKYANFRENGAWKPIYEEFVKKNVSPAPARRLFAKKYKKSAFELSKLTMSMYGLLQGNLAAGLPCPDTEFFSDAEYRGCWKANNMVHYLRNNITPVSDLAATACMPLLQDIIAGINKAQKKGCDVKMRGYFAHAETLLPLLSLMRLPGCFVMTSNYDDLDKVWQVQKITPLAGNLAIILLKGKSGEYYVSLRLNGQNIAPLTGEGKIVKWHDLRSYWKHIMREYSKR